MTDADAVAELASRPRFGKFVSVGAVGAALDLTASSALIVAAGVDPAAAKLVGAELAILAMFGINERWTFAGRGRPAAWPRRLLKSNAVRVGGLAVQFLVVRWLSDLDYSAPVAGFDLWLLLPLPIAILASMLLNYVAESLFTWRVTAETPR